MCAIELDGEAVVEYERMMITDLLSVEICFVKRVHGAKCVEERGNLFCLAANRDLDLLSVCVCVCLQTRACQYVEILHFWAMDE